MSENWDHWKDFPTYTERAIHRFEAEQKQIRWESAGVKDYVNIFVRDKFVGACPESYQIRLLLGDHRPIVSITTPEGVISMIVDLSEFTTNSEEVNE